VCILVLVIAVAFGGGGARARSVSTKSAHSLTTRALIKEAAQWSTIAQQDANPLLAVMHATYGTAYLNVARRLNTDADIEQATNVRVEEFSSTLQANQQAAVQKLLTLCPMSTPAGLAALQTGWMS
jgi:tRNA G26 N,N-dimethylase Trm1